MEGRFLYEGAKRRVISFPLGGIGSGCVGLDGTGRLVDWEIFNRPGKKQMNGFSFFAVKAEKDGKTVDARVLNADLEPPYMGEMYNGGSSFGFGPDRKTMAGVPHFRGSAFEGRFPLAGIRFEDETFPGQARLSALNPFIPLDDLNSSLPVAMFEVTMTNTTDEPLDYTVAFSLNNPCKQERVHHLRKRGRTTAIELTSDACERDDPAYGALTLATNERERVSWQQYWYHGHWFDSVGIFWQDFNAPGPLRDRVDPGRHDEDVATVAVTKTCAPGETASFRFAMSWYFPNAVNYWRPEKDAAKPRVWKNYYATRFDGAFTVADYALTRWDELEGKTRAFADALYASDLPPEALEAVGANLSVLKSPTCLRLEDGSFYAFEGCNYASGSCEGSCTHVWNYAFALPYLFPRLERSMRELDYTYNLREDGGMPFRLQLPLGRERSSFRPCVDGQMGGVIKTYREWKLGAGDEWLKTWWPKVKKSLEFAWSPSNADRWDPEATGVITGRQHHTLDMELFGPNSWLNTFYLAALKAASQMARAVGDADAERYETLYRQGAAYTEGHLFNGEYYHQQIDILDKSILERYPGVALGGGSAVDAYWNDEAKQIKYQVGEGCGIDQVLAQWMSDLVGLGDVLDREHVKSALRSIYRYNFKKSLRGFFNPCRVFGLNDEAGTVICEWPEGHKKPVVPVPYSEETMHGFEYQAASHMILRGMEDEGLEMVRAVRDRYDGERRNPWNEFECGSNYARSMASFALLLAYSGLVCDAPKGRFGMKPLKGAGTFFWSVEGAWGEMTVGETNELRVKGGALTLREWVLPNASQSKTCALNGAPLAFAPQADALRFEEEIAIAEGGVLRAK